MVKLSQRVRTTTLNVALGIITEVAWSFALTAVLVLLGLMALRLAGSIR